MNYKTDANSHQTFKYEFTIVNYSGVSDLKLQLIQPQEIEVFYILPAIRSRMAYALKRQGLRQKEIAGLLCVQESTVSQYLNSKRAADVKFNNAIDKEVEAAVKRIKSKEDLIRETQRILEMSKSEKITCNVHKSVSDVPAGCDVCFLHDKS